MARARDVTRSMRARVLRLGRTSLSSPPGDAAGAPVPTAVVRCRPHDEVCVTGVLDTVTGTDVGAGSGPSLEAALDDGSGRVVLVWLGRSSIRAVEPGRRLRVQGRLAEWKGQRVIYNPDYQLLSGQR